MVKKIINNAFERALHLLAFAILKTCHLSWTYKTTRAGKQDDNPKDARKKTEEENPEVPAAPPCVYVLWHEYMFPALILATAEKVLFIASRSGGGRAIGKVMTLFGLPVTYGSKNRAGKDKGGKEAKQALLTGLENGVSSIITVDGSVGPRRLCKAGPVDLARKTGRSIVPIGCAFSSYWQFRTWDKLKLPKPFAKICIHYGRPIFVSSGITRDQFVDTQLQITKAINEAEKEAARRLFEEFGSEYIPPEIEHDRAAYLNL